MPLGFYVLFLAGSVAASYDPLTSARGLTEIFTLSTLLMAPLLVRNERQVRLVVDVLIGAAAVLACAGLSQYLWKLEQPAHAVANGYFVGAINRVGTEAPWNIGEFYGQSYFCDPRGQFVAQGSRDKDELITAELDDEGQVEYFMGASTANWFSWQVPAVAGILLADVIPTHWGLGFAGVLALLGLTYSLISDRATALAAVVAGAAAVAAFSLPFRLHIVVAIAAAVCIGLMMDGGGDAGRRLRAALERARPPGPRESVAERATP